LGAVRDDGVGAACGAAAGHHGGSLYKRSLAIREKAPGPNHPDIATPLNNLAELYRLGEPLYHRSLAIRDKVLGPGHPDVATSLNNLAELYRDQGDYADALSLVRKTIASARAISSIAVAVLFGAPEKGLIPPPRPATMRSMSCSGLADAGGRRRQQAWARLAAGSDRLLQLVRRDQDLAIESYRHRRLQGTRAKRRPGGRRSRVWP
jgi:hypothetical protein